MGTGIDFKSSQVASLEIVEIKSFKGILLRQGEVLRRHAIHIRAASWFSGAQFTSIGGGSLPSGNVVSQALMTSNIFPSWPEVDIMFIPNARPLKSAKPRGKEPTGYPAQAATLAMRPSAGPRMTSTSCSARLFKIAEVERCRISSSPSAYVSSVMLLLSASINTCWLGASDIWSVKPPWLFCHQLTRW